MNNKEISAVDCNKLQKQLLIVKNSSKLINNFFYSKDPAKRSTINHLSNKFKL